MVVTLKDIARVANVSQMTVSRVLNNNAGNMVSEAMKQKILGIAEKYNYRPNRFAKVLRTGTVPIIALALHKEEPKYSELGRSVETDYYLNSMINGFAREFQLAELEMIFISYSSIDDLGSRLSIFKQENFISGVVTNIFPDELERQCSMLKSLQLPVVVLGDCRKTGIPCTFLNEDGVLNALKKEARKAGMKDAVLWQNASEEELADPEIWLLVHGEYNFVRVQQIENIAPERLVLYSLTQKSFIVTPGYIFDPLLDTRIRYSVEMLQRQCKGEDISGEFREIAPGENEMSYFDIESELKRWRCKK